MKRADVIIAPTVSAPISAVERVVPEYGCDFKKCEVTSNIGLFFDGTRNNQDRDRSEFSDSNCLVSCDHLPRRSWPLFRAKAMLGELIAGFSSPGIQSHQEQLAA